jgi:hypoxanthine-DNA glycosylase
LSEAKSFQPIIDLTSRVLVLGSMPGVQSLEQQKYYANPQNQFWRIIYSLFDTPLDPDYHNRIAFIKEKGIGLWDVLESCDREGSLDSNIRNEKANDFEHLFKTFSNIHCVLFNGAKAYEAFRKGVGFDPFGFITFERLPSTSPANAQRFEQKLSEWNILLNYINKKGGLEA